MSRHAILAAMTTKPPVKRRNALKTKANILEAAQKAFAEHGYDQTGIRDIAALADISSPLLLRYFGSKAGLFEAALIDAMRLDDLFKSNTELPLGLGRHLAQLFVDPNLELRPPSIITLSTGNKEARDIATRVTEEYILVPLAKRLGEPNGKARALEILILAMGFVLFTRQIPLAPKDKSDSEELINWFAESIQAIVDKA